jgi:hypothetical protein
MGGLPVLASRAEIIGVWHHHPALFSIKKEQVLMYATAWVNFRKLY